MTQAKENMTPAQSLAAIDKAIKKIGETFTNINGLVQDAGYSILLHAQRHGDCTKAAALVNALPKRLQPLLVKWFMTVSPIGVRRDADGNLTARYIKKDSAAFRPFNLEEAKALPWHVDIEKEKAKADEAQTFLTLRDFIEGLDKVVKKSQGEKALEKYSPHDRAIVAEAAASLQRALDRLRFVTEPAGKDEATPEGAPFQESEEAAKALILASLKAPDPKAKAA